MRVPVCTLGFRPRRIKKPRRRRQVQRNDARKRVLCERVAYMLWVMANGVD